MRNLLLLGIVLGLFLIPGAMASGEYNVQAYKQRIDYVAALAKNTWYNTTIAFKPLTYSSTSSSFITVYGDLNSESTLELLVNDVACNPASIVPPGGTRQERFFYDCSAVMNKPGNYRVSFRYTSSSGASYFRNFYGEVEILYVDNPRAGLTIHGTEYVTGTLGKVWLQLLDSGSEVINNASCFVDVYTPSNAQYIERARMNFLEDGVYYYDLLIPQTVGVYPVVAICYYTTASNDSVATNGAITIGTSEGGSYASTQALDGTFWKIKTAKIGTDQHLEAYLNFSGITQPTLFTGISLDAWTRWDSSLSNIRMWGWNFTSNNWLPLPNLITNTGGSVVQTSNTLPITNVTSAGIMNAGRVWLKFNTTSGETGGGKHFWIDYAIISMTYQSGGVWTSVKGSSEIHVTSIGDLSYDMSTNCRSVYGFVYADDYTGDCAIMRNDTIYNLPEGMLTDNITIRALQTKDTLWTYQLPADTSCSALYAINQTLPNGTISPINLSTVQLSSVLGGACKVQVPLDMTLGTSYYYRFYMDNSQKYKVMTSQWHMKIIMDNLNSICLPYASAHNYLPETAFAVPVSATHVHANDTILASCHQAYDLYYWNQVFYNGSIGIPTPITDIGHYYTFYKEIVLYVEPKLYEFARTIETFTGFRVLNPVTFCGDSTSSCAKFVNDTDFNFPEGAVEDNVTVTAYGTKQDAIWTYKMPVGTSCNALYWIKWKNSTGSVYSNLPLSTVQMSTQSGGDGCLLTFRLNATIDTAYNYIIRYDNYQKYKVFQEYGIFKQVNVTMFDYCQAIASDYNYTYPTPIVGGGGSVQSIFQTVFENSTNLFRCLMWHDLAYWTETFWWQSMTANTTGQYSTFYDEFYRFFTPRIMDNYNFYQSFVSEGNTAPYVINDCIPQIAPVYGVDRQLTMTDGCALLVNDTDYFLPEGELAHNFSITGTRNEVGDEAVNLHYLTAGGETCGAIYSIQNNNTGTWLDYNANIDYLQAPSNSCQLNIRLYNITKGASQHFRIRADNYPKYKVLQSMALVDALNQSYMPMCDIVATYYNWTYTVPLLATTPMPNQQTQPDLWQCAWAKDQMYWAYLFHANSLTASKMSQYSGYYDEFNSFMMPNIRGIIQAYLMWGIYGNVPSAQAIPTSLQARFNYTNSLIYNTSFDVWNYQPSRNLTYYPPASVNTSGIVNYTYFDGQFLAGNNTANYWGNNLSAQVSATNSSIMSRLDDMLAAITNIPSLVWAYGTRTLSSFGFAVNTTQEVLDNIWSYTTRTLTTYGVQNNTYNYTYNNTVIYNQTVNVSIVNATYNYTTIYNQTLNLTVDNITNTYNYTFNNTEIYNNTQIYNQTLNLTVENVTNIYNNTVVYNQTVNVTVNNTNSTTIINNTYPVTVEVVNQTVNVTNAIVYNMTVNVTTQNVTVVNQSVDFTNVTNAIAGLDTSMANNFTYTNGLITSVNDTVNYWGAMNNGTTTYWGTVNQNETMYWGSLNYNLTAYWGTLNYNLINSWGNALSLQLYNITMGNVSVTAIVDYDEIALTVMSYLMSIQGQKSSWGLI